ncbi:MAG TPA: TolC family protein [Spirochaetota bacterium]|nr:TolC family protein [Spirochaetota bacterium]HNT12821.1 TolC family protein [Spirochaetota bacterium]
MLPRTLITIALLAVSLSAAAMSADQSRLIRRASGVPEEDSAGAAPLRSLGLYDLYALAVRNTERMKIEAENVEQAIARKNQAIGSFLPRVSLRAAKVFPEDAETLSSFATIRTGVYLIARQPIFTGLDEWTRYRGAVPDLRMQQFNARFAASRLLFDVSYAFFRVLQIEKSLASRTEILRLYGRNIQELRRRVHLGKSRQSDVLRTQSQIHKIEADILAFTNELERARLDLSTITGIDIGKRELRETADPPRPLPVAENMRAYVEDRWDVRAAVESVAYAKTRVLAAKGGHLPQVYVEGGYRFYQPEDIKKGPDYFVAIGADFPIFAGLTVVSKTREAESAMRQAELRLRQARRIARQDIIDSNQSYETSTREIEAYRKALATADENYRTVLRDYRLNLVSVLDVFSALTTLQSAREDFDRVSLQHRLNRIRLGIAVNEFAAGGIDTLRRISAPIGGTGR